MENDIIPLWPLWAAIIGVLFWLIPSLVVANTWDKKGLSYSVGLFVSLFLSPVTGLLLGIFEMSGSYINIETTKECPDCKEHIQASANVCKYCGHKFEKEEVSE